MSETTEWVICLRVLCDDPTLEWWQALGLPDPARWSLSDTFAAPVFAKPIFEDRVMRGALAGAGAGAGAEATHAGE